MRKNRIAALSQAALLSLTALGCTTFPSFRRGGETTPLGAARPGPMKQLAAAVSGSSFGRSVSKAFQSGKEKSTPENDPTSLASGIAPTKAGDYVMMGENLEQNGDAEGARRMFHKALEMEPHHLGALVGLGRHFDRQGQLDRASEHYLEATQHHPNEATAYNDLGLCYARQRRYDDAVQALNRAIELQPDRALYRNNIAMALVAEGRVDEALAHLTDAHGPAIAHYNVAFLLNKQGLNRPALDHFKLALANDPSMEDAREWVDALSAGPEQGAADAMIAAAPVSNDAGVEEAAAGPLPEDVAPRGRQNVASLGRAPRASPPPTAGNLQPLPPVVVAPSSPTRRY